MTEDTKLKILATKCGSCGCGCPTIMESGADELVVVGKLDDFLSRNASVLQYTGDGEIAVVIPKSLLLEAAKALSSE